MALLKYIWRLRSPCMLPHQVKRCLTSPVVSYYDAINQGEQEVPEYFNFASDVMDKWVQVEKDEKTSPNTVFWWVNDQKEEVKWSYEELAVLSRKAANVLTGPCGLQRGDRLMIVLPKIPEWWLLVLASVRTGIIFIPGTSQLTAKDISYRLQSSKAKCIVVSDALAPAVDSVMSECTFLKTKLIVSNSSRDGWLNFKELFQAAPADHNCVRTKSDDTLAMYFTSGTTGTPKMVSHSHASYGIGLTTVGRRLMNLNRSSVFWNISDPGWVKAAWCCLFTTWMNGACVFIHHLPVFDPAVILNTLSSYPITNFCAPPTGYRMMVQHDITRYKFMRLNHCVTGGEALNPEVYENWKKQTGLDIYEGYGQTETVAVCANEWRKKIKPGSMGMPCPPYDVQIIDDQGNIQPPGTEGDIAIRIKPKRPFCLFQQYVDDTEKTAASERGDFYSTGDRGVKDEDGYFWFVSRSDDVINSAGYRIGPFEVESALIEHPAVVESAVVSSPDPVRKEVVKAFVVLSPNFLSHDPEKLMKELQDHVKKVTAPYKYPRKIEFVQELPKTATGKIQRNVLRKREWGKI
ncbi:acyl-coenzyme A synthetase ACSM5, mitochondrial-like [Sceloporus undulatus]|uniref:acyl-coenzyme A synthetase ACSM5, mitochondrial-like n=1 Tax=Sceloporus undulatus TaxID=8520 RepID=UPI001C4BE0FD|nr:acyl-coenzyme A synthetase ACSM5, mitochondrial-like [Sceloporus undulatus]XP_042336818.1 acyl-coenzyme A synthetase ACSM5, mitochondrial-like [Sceloporus undulatus]